MGSKLRIVVFSLLLANGLVWLLNGYYQQLLAEAPEGLGGRPSAPLETESPVKESVSRSPSIPASVATVTPAQRQAQAIAEQEPPAEIAAGKWGRAISNWFAKSLCRELGPFNESVLASRLLGSLSVAGAEASLVTRTVSVPETFWVLVPIADAAAGKALGAKLDTVPMRDWQIVRSSPLGMALSMGLFNTQTSANARLAKVKAAVPDAVVHVKRQSRPQYWVRATAPENVLKAEYETVATVQNCSAN